jgi:hypothetical protein
MKTHLLMGGDNVTAEVRGGDLVLTGTDHMVAAFTNLRDKRLKKVSLYLAEGLELKLVRSDGWEIIIKKATDNSNHLIITRHRSVDERMKQRQYLGTNMEWMSFPKGECILPDDALRLPIFAP